MNLRLLPLTAVATACIGPHIVTRPSPASPSVTFACLSRAAAQLGFALTDSQPATGFFRAERRDPGSPGGAEYSQLAASVYSDRNSNTYFMITPGRSTGPMRAGAAAADQALDSDNAAADSVARRCTASASNSQPEPARSPSAARSAAPASVRPEPNPPSPERTASPSADTVITLAEFAARRDSLAARIGTGVIVAFGGRTPVTDFGPFFQLPGFHYLTGFDEPDAAFVLVARQGHPSGTLFLTAIDPRMAFYYGRRPDTASVTELTGLPGRSFGALASVLDSLAGAGVPFYSLGDYADADFATADSLTRGQLFMRNFAAAHAGLAIRDAAPIVDQLRARKSAAEIALLTRAAEISSEGHRAAMLLPQPRHEYELRAELEHVFTRLGAERVAYGSIVGAGVNGTQLHYMKDMAAARPGDMVVMDAGAEYRGYAADVTRSIPVSGVFTPEQRQIYQLVRDAQAAAERNSRAGVPQRAAEDSSFAVRAAGLARLGLVESADATFDPPWRVDCTRQPSACRQATLWTIHGISHGLGLAVHDPVQFYYGDRTYQVGDVFTIEPGIYISQASLDALPDTPRNRAFIAHVQAQVTRFRNIGVRIEDDYVITPAGLVRISSAPREIGEIEALMRSR